MNRIYWFRLQNNKKDPLTVSTSNTKLELYVTGFDRRDQPPLRTNINSPGTRDKPLHEPILTFRQLDPKNIVWMTQCIDIVNSYTSTRWREIQSYDNNKSKYHTTVWRFLLDMGNSTRQLLIHGYLISITGTKGNPGICISGKHKLISKIE